MANHSSFLALQIPWTVWKDKKLWYCKVSPPRSESVQYATGKEWRTVTNSYRKNEAFGPKQKQHSVVDVSGSKSEVGCCKEQYPIGTSNVRFMNQGKLEGKRRRGQQRMRWLDSITDWTDMNLSKVQDIVKDRGAWHAIVHGVPKSWTWLSN